MVDGKSLIASIGRISWKAGNVTGMVTLELDAGGTHRIIVTVPKTFAKWDVPQKLKAARADVARAEAERARREQVHAKDAKVLADASRAVYEEPATRRSTRRRAPPAAQRSRGRSSTSRRARATSSRPRCATARVAWRQRRVSMTGPRPWRLRPRATGNEHGAAYIGAAEARTRCKRRANGGAEETSACASAIRKSREKSTLGICQPGRAAAF